MRAFCSHLDCAIQLGIVHIPPVAELERPEPIELAQITF